MGINHDNEVEIGFGKFSIKELVSLIISVIISVCLVAYWGEIMSLIVSNPIPSSLSFMGLAITVWLIRIENKKERQERQKARKIDEERAWDY